MAPSEAAILSNFLLTPSQLPAIISLQQFTALFPRSQQSSPLIRALYRDLQNQRNVIVDQVAANVDEEVSRAKALRREVVKARREAESQEYDDEVEIERTLGAKSNPDDPKHDLSSVVIELDSATNELESELKRLEAEQAELRDSVGQTIGSLSDLKYGRLANTQLPDQVLQGLTDLQETCKRRS